MRIPMKWNQLKKGIISPHVFRSPWNCCLCVRIYLDQYCHYSPCPYEFMPGRSMKTNPVLLMPTASSLVCNGGSLGVLNFIEVKSGHFCVLTPVVRKISELAYINACEERSISCRYWCSSCYLPRRIPEGGGAAKVPFHTPLCLLSLQMMSENYLPNVRYFSILTTLYVQEVFQHVRDFRRH